MEMFNHSFAQIPLVVKRLREAYCQQKTRLSHGKSIKLAYLILKLN